MAASQRVDWVDYAKGFCIVMVVTMHSTLGVEKAAGTEGWMHYLVEFARPFRMPDFFLISGLFLARVIDRDWRTYLDKKVVHFAYFYVLWLTIQFAFKAPGIAAEAGWGAAAEAYALGFIDPFGTLWFIYLLPVFFVVTKALRSVPWWIVWTAGALLQAAPINTGWTLVDEFASRFVYFYTGYVFAPLIFRLAEGVLSRGWMAAGLLLAWAFLEAALVFNGVTVTAGGAPVFVSFSDMPGISLGLGLIGACAVVAFSALLSKADLMAPLRYLGRNSIVIYLAFFLPMATARTALLKLGIIEDVGTISVLVTAAGVIVPVLLFWAVRGTPLKFLFERPAWARLRPAGLSLAPAE